MSLLPLIINNLLSFILIISCIVFVHEFGHFLVARLCGVKVEEFSIGFGKELIGFNDKKGTRWKFSILPFGGYVKMYKDKNFSSAGNDPLESLTEEEKKHSFIGKKPYQKAMIVAAGPIANFILTILIFTFLFNQHGVTKIVPVIDSVLPGSPAMSAGIEAKDKIVKIDDVAVDDFEQVRRLISESKNEEIRIELLRKKEIVHIVVKPKIESQKSLFGDEVRVKMVGIAATMDKEFVTHQSLNIWQSFVQANIETKNMTKAVFIAVGELITGKRPINELSGPIKMAEYSGQSMKMGFYAVLWLAALISLNLGVMNLLPIPVLDGGHLFFYLIESVIRKPIPNNFQQIAFAIGASLLVSLMIFTVLNDIHRLLP